MDWIGSRGLRLVAVAVSVAIAAAAAAGSARAEISYQFNPLLSLTGACGVSELDPVPDPGLCPMPPGVPGVDHPLKAFSIPTAVTTDLHGDIYVASYGSEAKGGAEGRIDVFAPDGTFIYELPDESGPRALAVDSAGNLYVSEFRSGILSRTRRFPPSAYNPAAREIAYAKPPVVVVEGKSGPIAIDPTDDHFYSQSEGAFANSYTEYSSAEEGNAPLGVIGEETHGQARGIAVDAKRGRFYASDTQEGKTALPVVRVFELSGTHKLLETIDGSSLPAGKFASEPSLAVSEGTGDLLTYSEEEVPLGVNRLTSTGGFIENIPYGFKKTNWGAIAIDNGPSSPNKGYLFVPSHAQGTGHAFAFGPEPEKLKPTVESLSFTNVSASEAQLRSKINPGSVPTSYIFEYTTDAQFEAKGFTGAQVAGEGQLPAISTGVEVAANAEGLQPQTAYRFRVVAENSLGKDEEEGSFSTYPLEESQTCPNEETRTGLSTLLPDCRAYELVTPADTNARAPLGIGFSALVRFATREASPAGDRVSFHTEGGVIPGFEGTGSLQGDQYLATRGPSGWTTASAGPNGAEATAPTPGSTSPDQGFSFWLAGGEGSAVIGGATTFYVRYPDGHSALVGRGSLGSDTQAQGRWITAGGTHIVFESPQQLGHTAVQLEPDAPPTGTQAIYDRTADEVTHVVSLLPGNETPKAGENATYEGASSDGRDIAFSIKGTLYLRHDDATTYEVAKEATFAGVAEGGGRVFYLKGGNLFAFDVATQETIPFSSSGDVTPVNISADGTAAYFVSPSVLTGEENPNEATAQKGEENLYLSREGAISFVGTVTERDVKGELGETEQIDGLGLWISAVQLGGAFGKDPSRTTPDGGVLLFSSQAKLGSYDPEGEPEIYRYDAAAPSLECISCNPTGAPASAGASLQPIQQSVGRPEPFTTYAFVENLRADGRRAFFQSTEPLVARDTDHRQDVYEWEAQEVGGCNRPGGCVFLISSGQSSRDNYLYAVSEGGEDVFFTSPDLLVGADRDSTSSIYDARVGGGFAEPPPREPCQGEGCRPGLAGEPPLLAPESGVQSANGNAPSHRCPKGKREVKRQGRVRCIKPKHHRKQKQSRSGAKQKGSK
jgi:hypothetical protein